LLAIRSNQNASADPIESLRDYFGAFRSPEWDEVSKMEEDIENFKKQNEEMRQEIEKIKKQKADQIEINRIKEQERLQKLAEEEAKKAKKGGKK
jgi:regulator of replication initiation timing